MADNLEKEFDQEIDLDTAFDAEEDLEASFDAEEPSGLQSAVDKTKQAGGALTTAAAIKAGQMGVEKLIGDSSIEDVIGLAGKMSPEQVGMIIKDPKGYGKARDMANILDEFSGLSKQISEKGYSTAQQAKELIKEKDLGLPTEDIQKSLGESLKKEAYKVPEPVVDPLIGTAHAKEVASDMPESLQKVSGPAVMTGAMKSKAKEQARILDAMGPEVKGQNLVNLLEDYGDMANYSKDAPSNVQAVFRNTRDQVREATGKLDKDVDNLFKQSHQAIKDQETLKKLLKIKEVIKGDPEAGPQTARELGRIFGETADDYAKTKVHINDIIERYTKAGLLDEAGSAAIKEYIEKSTKLTTKGLMSAGAAGMFNKMLGMALFARETVGTKAQEVMARTVGHAKAPAESTAGKVVKGAMKGAGMVAKGAYKALPLVGGVAVYNAARAEGKSPTEAATIAAIDEATDIVLPLKLALMPSSLAEDADVVPGEPMKEFEGAKTLEELHDAMEAQVEKPEAEIPFKPKKEINVQEELKSPQKLESMLEQFNKLREESTMADVYAKSLERLRDTDQEESKAAMRFSLAQQPAFRKLLKKAEKK